MKETVGLSLWKDIRKGGEEFTQRKTFWVKNGVWTSKILVGQLSGELLYERSFSFAVQFSFS